MADTIIQVVVSPFMQVLLDNLSSLIHNEFGLAWGIHKEMEKLSSTLSIIQAVLDDAEEKQVMNKSIRNWLRKLKDAAYEADDVLDLCAFEGLESASELRSNSCTKQVLVNFSSLNYKHTILCYKIGKRMKKLSEKFDEIASERSKFHLTDGSVDRRVELCRDRETSSMLTEPQVYGRDAEMADVVIILLHNVYNEGVISVLPIIGIGGLGKTTLAQLVYNHHYIQDCFEVRVWVCVSEDFDVRRLTKAILVSLSGTVGELEELDALQQHLGEKLRGRRFLLVLDDVWNANQDNWNKLMCSFRCGAKGSSVIVTTRLETVASITATLPTYHLKVLGENDCWSVFKQRAFRSADEERPNLVEIGKEIVKKCGGVPLAAKALGGLLRFNNDEKKWLSVRDGEIRDLPESSENNILPALRLSYNHLPSHLKQCFAYCSVFPKHHVIEKEELIHLWMANGLVRPQGRMELEDVGNETFNALLSRSFFQDITKDEDDNIKTCKMHSVVHDLACYIAMDECSTMKAENINTKTRHLSMLFNTEKPSSKLGCAANSSPGLRSLILFNGWSPKQSPQLIFSSLMHLRALNLRCAPITVLPKLIGKMKHLRYLNFSDTQIRALPKSICGLRNVQTIKLKRCNQLQTLPRKTRNLCSLRHLDIQGCERLTETPIRIGQLTCLRTLSMFIVGSESGRGIVELQGLNLEGELEIKGIEHVKTSLEANKANLMRKQDLRTLCLSWGDAHLQKKSIDVIEGLQPHSSITRLFIKQYDGVNFPSWLSVSSVPNLVEISLFRCRRCTNLPPVGQLPLLKVLKINSMDYVKFITDEVYGVSVMAGFPSLEELSLSIMPSLEGWSSTPFSYSVPSIELTVQVVQEPSEHQAELFPCLKKLILEECPKLGGVKLSPSLKHVKVRKCSEMVLQSLQNLPSLSTLEISDFEEAVSFPEGMLENLPALGKLNIRSCYNLTTLPVGLESLYSLTSLAVIQCKKLVSLAEDLSYHSFLKSLSIYECHSLKCLPKLGTSFLEDIHIYDCPELEFSRKDFQNIGFLRTLSLCMLPKLKSVPENLKLARRLQNLSILGCCNLMELPNWIGSLGSLQTLHIEGFKNLKVLPDGMKDLTSLQRLEMVGCHPELKKRCEKDEGEDWYKLSHVPYVVIRS